MPQVSKYVTDEMIESMVTSLQELIDEEKEARILAQGGLKNDELIKVIAEAKADTIKFLTKFAPQRLKLIIK